MARPKGAKNVKKHVFKDPTIEEIVEMEVEIKDPKTGKIIKQKVKVKRLKAVKNFGPKEFVGASSVLDDLEQEENERLLSAEPDPEE
jgi:hypothetical protein